jgi:hypothetical protein
VLSKLSSAPSVVPQIAATVGLHLYSKDPACSALQVRELKHLFTVNGTSPDYERLAISFAKAFFPSNFWKTLTVLEATAPSPACTILDAGAGSGAATLAYLAWLEDCFSKKATPVPVRVLYVDQSQAQLNLSRELLAAVSHHFEHLNLRCDFICADICTLTQFQYKPECILLSHVLTENLRRSGLLLSALVETLSDGGHLYVIERPDDEVWETIDSSISSLALPVTTGQLVLRESELKNVPFPELSASMPLRARYTIIHAPNLRLVRDLVKSYFRAWETQSVETVSAIFANNAEYYEKPFATPFIGVAEICRYWREKVLPQKEPRTRILDVMYTDNRAFVEWEARFGTSLGHRHLRGVLHLSVDSGKGQIVQLREYFTKKEA